MTTKPQLILLLVFVILVYPIKAQVDNEFWLAPPSATFYDVGDEDDIEIVITAMQATTVTIEKPATGWAYTTPLIGAFASLSLKMGADLGLNMTEIETPPQPLPLGPLNLAYKNGYKITSDPGLITISYKLTNDKSQDQISLKGKNALGTEFYVSTQNVWPNENNNYYNGFSIVATADNTTIEINRNNFWTAFPGPFPSVETVVLNEGETFTVLSLDNTIANHINGVYVTSDKEIAITYWDDQVAKNLTNENNYKYDFGGDQLVPLNIIGQDYIVMKGGMGFVPPPGDGGERVFITGTVDGTTVDLYNWNGALINSFVVNAGEIITHEVSIQSTYIKSTESIYVNHYSSVTNGQSVSVAVLPPVGPCTGSHDVVITRSPHASDEFILNILAVNDTVTGSSYKNKAAEGFFITTSRGTTQIPPNYFFYNDDSTYIVLDKINFQVDYLGNNPVIEIGETALIQNRNAKFHLGVIEGHKNSGAKYGYFSDYGGQSARSGIGGPDEDALEILCSLNPLRLVATGGRNYLWWVEGDSANSSNYLSALDISEPIYYPDTFTTRVFNVLVKQLCGGDYQNSLTVITLPQPRAYFEVESEEVCSPDSILITQGVDLPNVTMDWYFNSTTLGRSDNTDDITSFYHVLPDNNSDTINTYRIELWTNYLGVCTDLYSRTINIKPGIFSDFEFLGDSIGCHPLTVLLGNSSSGHIDSTSYFWDFGDNTISYEADSVTHTYNNYALKDSTYEINLITQSPFDCMDTSSKEITVYPRVKSLFSTTPSQGCSPLITNINPVNSIGVDTLLWHIDYFYNDSSFLSLNKTSFNIIHNDTSINSGPDTLYVELIGKNQYNCSDTALPHMLVTYPPSTADFDISDNTICDGDTIVFTNKSLGYNLDFYWDLGDGTAPNDSTPANKPYFNPSGTDLDYPISLTVISSNNCIDQKDTILTVHPYIDANFGINYVKNCSPLNVNITDNSYRAHIYSWDMGDGSPILTNSGDFTHQYSNPFADSNKIFEIKLNVENNEGCSDSIIKTLTVKPQVVAVMDIVNPVGCSPLNITFNNNSTGGSYYIWDLGGNNLRTDTLPVDFSEIYTNGTADDNPYYISLTARNDAGCDSTVYDTLNVFASIYANFTFNKDSSCSPFTAVLTNRSSSGAKVFDWYRDGDVIPFSNDITPVIPEFTNITDSPDIYEYKLIAYGANDPEHKVCADTHITSIKIFPELHTSFTLNDTSMCQPLLTPINNTSNLIDSSNFIWYLDNYIYSTQDQPGNLNINNYTNSDVLHTFKLIGETNHRCADTISKDVIVFAYIDANFTFNKVEICSGDSFSINRSNTRGLIDTYTWDFNGTSDNRAIEQFNYTFDNTSSAPSKKNVSLTVANSNCDASWTDSIQVNPLVTASFNAVDAAGCHPHTTNFTNLSSNADYYRWTFGDGVSTSEPTPGHTFQNFDPSTDKTYNVSLISESQYRCSDTLQKVITVYAAPNANFFLPISISCPPFDFSVINSSEGTNLTYTWDMDGDMSSEFQPVRTFNNLTSSVLYKPIKLSVESDKGCRDSISRNITIYPGINVQTTTNPSEGCSPLKVNFIGDTTNVQQMVWYVDGNLFSTQIAPSNTFLNETDANLSHDIKFVAYSKYNCVDSSESEVTIYPTPAADFVATPIPALYDTVNDQTAISFANLTKFQDYWDYSWDYGNGVQSTNGNSNYVFNYDEFFWGTYKDGYRIPITLIATNKDNPECKDTIIRDVMIIPPIPRVEIGEDVAGCVPFTVDFSSFTKYAYDEKEWNFGDGTIETTKGDPIYTYTTPGTYTAKLNVEGDGGLAADYKLVTVYRPPEVNFSFNDTLVFVADQREGADIINFYNHTKNATEFVWYFDATNLGADTNSLEQKDYSTEKDPTHYYQEVGVYQVALWAKSGDNCTDSLIHHIPITVMGEGYIAFPTGFLVDPDSPPGDEYNSDQVTPEMYLFYPQNNGVKEYKLEVYNRWGTLIFESDDVKKGWNGYIDGLPAKQDVYIWRAKGRFTNGAPFDKSGDVTLIRSPLNPTR